MERHEEDESEEVVMERHEEDESEEVAVVVVVVGEVYCAEEKREITVKKMSSFCPDDGFEAYDNNTGDLVFRVETYGPSPDLADELVLMDGAGSPILTIRRKWLSLHQRWDGFRGERHEGQKHLFTVRRSSMFGGDGGAVEVEVHERGCAVEYYRVEGSFRRRCCRVLYGNGDGLVVAEIKRKGEACGQHGVLGRDVFSLCLKPRFDAAFAMALVLVLDQISSDEDLDEGDEEEGGSYHGEGMVNDEADDHES